MKNKIIITTIVLMNIISPAYSLTVSNEIKAGAFFLLKMSIGVVISAIVIGIGLWLFSLLKLKMEMNKVDSRAEDFTCEIDDTKTIGDAIKTFLAVNK